MWSKTFLFAGGMLLYALIENLLNEIGYCVFRYLQVFLFIQYDAWYKIILFALLTQFNKTLIKIYKL